MSSTRAVKSLRLSAKGEMNRRGLLNTLRVSHSTTILAGRSLRLQIMARSPSRSPDCTPSVKLRPVLHRSNHRRRQTRQQKAGADDLHHTAPAQIEMAHAGALLSIKRAT